MYKYLKSVTCREIVGFQGTERINRISQIKMKNLFGQCWGFFIHFSIFILVIVCVFCQ